MKCIIFQQSYDVEIVPYNSIAIMLYNDSQLRYKEKFK